MASTINTNIASLNAQRNLGMSAASLTTTMQRLSSGLRVNSAKDDAAGLAIAERMNTQVKGLAVASRNANDGISLAQTAEGALGKVGDMLQRMRELAVQASNATNSKADRAALQSEVKQLTDEIDRVSKQTSFNGQKILDGSFAGALFQVGANSGDNVTLGALADTRASGLSSIMYSSTSTAIAVDASDTSISAFGSAIPAGGLTIQVGSGSAIDLGSIKAAGSGVERLGQVISAINNKTADTGVTAFLTKNDDGSYGLEFASSKLTNAVPPVPETVTFGGTTGFTVANTGFTPPTLTNATGTGQKGIDSVDVGTQSQAWVALKKIDSAIDQVNSARADLGALQSRFENAIANIDIQGENMSAARGRIVDADFAKETANLSRTQILQQAGTAMVAQANQLPQQVLKLLQG
ncbi:MULTISPECIES: flagellin [unclassified Acidovorax]|uniref:flagellin n=1 Tax=unclassified Acidovorax TaxID=2684926 RepID=UPI0023DE3510|nr:MULTISPECIES: flagellin [unclassified Acidovorax]GKS86733.1 flagellin [Acidovorax sp. SUPP1855]GKS92546.1 flagellin [Acidovorax sp. SUPP2539]GKS97286.1 flagellin [Acidovorax sp. SUPP2825]GKT02025.1 flagellin [Acidovorax sp. SUPP3434]